MVKVACYLFSLLPLVVAWPTAMEMNKVLVRSDTRLNTGVGHPNPSFSAKDQYVDVTAGSKNEFRSPGKYDLRGQCPGLNAAANHGFLPRNGKPTIADTVTGLVDAYNMHPLLAASLAAIAVLISGDIPSLTWSIGGKFPSTLPLILGEPQGLLGTHNKFEGDASIVRGDAYLNGGDVGAFTMSSWNNLMDIIGSDLTLEKATQLSDRNTQYSINNNPHYFSGPFSGLVAPTAYNFVVNFMSNHSADVPGGFLAPEVVKSFFAVTGDKKNGYVHNRGQERIPENWYRRPGGVDQYTATDVFLELIAGAEDYPNTLRLGGNIGTTNSFTGIDLKNLTGGVFNAATLLEGNNLACFAFQAAMAGGIDELDGLLGTLGSLLDPVLEPIKKVFEGLECPQLKDFNSQLFDIFPGAGN